VPDARQLRTLLVATQITTVVLTWPLHGASRETPLLPTLGALASLSFGWPLVVSALASLRWPRGGWALHVGVLAVSMLADRTRLQPSTISVATLLWACRGRARIDGTLLGAHFAALWMAAGAGKLASGAFAREVAPVLAGPHAGAWAELLGWAELALGALVLVPRTRRAALATGALLHAGFLVALASAGWNPGVWAWNAGLAGTALVHAATRRREGEGAPRGAWVPALAALGWPLLFPLGLAPPSTAFFVYSGLEPVTLRCAPGGRCLLDHELHASMAELGAPVPASVELLEASFQASCRPGDRWLARERSGEERVLAESECAARRERP
jgi:hypothetical protein